MPSGELHRRNLDANDVIDDFAAVGVVEPGQYLLSALPKPNLPVGEEITLEFTLDGELYRLANGIPMSASGYEFGVWLGYNCGVFPRPGKFTQVNPPTFGWQGDGQFDLQLASDTPEHPALVGGLQGSTVQRDG